MDITRANFANRIKTLFRSPIAWIVSAAVVILLIAGYAWWYHVQSSPEKMFWSMINNSLSTGSFSRTLELQEGNQKLNQVVEIRTSPEHLANSRSTVSQGEPTTTRVVTESVGTPRNDYSRYTEITVANTERDFSNVKNVWGMTETDGTSTNGQLYNEAVLGLVPLGNLNASDRSALIRQMKDNNAYTFEMTSVKRTGLLRRPSYSYDVQVNPAAYIGVIKEYAHKIGLTHLESVDPEQYRSTQPVAVQIVLDGWSRQLTQVSFAGDSRVEKFTAYGSIKPLQLPPTETVPVSELQARLQSAQ